MDVRIRPCKPCDLLPMREICAVCDDPAHPERLAWVLPMYLDYYVERCADTCFVAADGDGLPVGYILCAPDNAAYRRDFRRSGTLRKVFSGSVGAGLGFLLRSVWEARFTRTPYAAHLHIDILPGYRRGGLGRALMDTLLGELGRRGVPGVMLCCAAKNQNGRRFYEAYGFTRLGAVPGAVYYGIAST